jgi:3',5'-cyclic AMP phosphodiesterase CpdA
MRIVQISDTHISHLGGRASENFSCAADYVNEQLRPDLVIHTGDVVVLNPDNGEDRQTAWRLHQLIKAPVLVLPGNHDVGETGDNPWMGLAVTSERIEGHIRTWGPDRFFELGPAGSRADGWALVGLNSERMSSELPEEAEQWEWLESIAARVRGMSVALFLHKPLWWGGVEKGITVARADRDRLLGTFRSSRVRLVGNGHVHRYRTGAEGGIFTVSAPSLTFASPADPDHGLGPSSSGVVEYQVDGEHIEARFCAVPGVEGTEDILSMPEVAAAMAEIQASATV